MRRAQLWCCLQLLLLQALIQYLVEASSPSPSGHRPKVGFKIPGHSLKVDFDDEGSTDGWFGSGREFDIFDSRGGDEVGGLDAVRATAAESDAEVLPTSSQDFPRGSFPASNPYRRTAPTASSTSYNSNSRSYSSAGGRSYSSRRSTRKSFFHPVSDWWTSNISPNIRNWPKIQCRVEPTTTLKIRKTFRPLKTIVRLGADFNTQLGVWQFKSSWEDALIGGKLTLAGRELQITKSWQLSVGAVEDLVTRLRFRAAVDLSTWKAYARVGFRTERLSPINVMEGFTVLKQVPLDGTKGHVKLEVRANFALPEPEIEYSTETQRSLIGMGDIEVNIEELNLVLDY